MTLLDSSRALLTEREKALSLSKGGLYDHRNNTKRNISEDRRVE